MYFKLPVAERKQHAHEDPQIHKPLKYIFVLYFLLKNYKLYSFPPIKHVKEKFSPPQLFQQQQPTNLDVNEVRGYLKSREYKYLLLIHVLNVGDREEDENVFLLIFLFLFSNQKRQIQHLLLFHLKNMWGFWRFEERFKNGINFKFQF